MTAPDPYAQSTFHGKLLDNATIAALKIAEQKLGYNLTITQGIGGADASAGTHTKGRAVDLAAYDHARKVRVLQDIGFAVWYRPYRAGVWGAHIHGVLIFPDRTNREGIDDTAWRQIGQYDRLEDGLLGDVMDSNKYRPDPKARFTRAEYEGTFTVPVPRIVTTHVTKARDRLVEAIHAAGQAIAELDNTNPARVAARAQMDEIRAGRQQLKAALAALPER